MLYVALCLFSPLSIMVSRTLQILWFVMFMLYLRQWTSQTHESWWREFSSYQEGRSGPQGWQWEGKPSTSHSHLTSGELSITLPRPWAEPDSAGRKARHQSSGFVVPSLAYLALSLCNMVRFQLGSSLPLGYFTFNFTRLNAERPRGSFSLCAYWEPPLS